MEIITMSQKLFYSELDAKQIYLEIIKRFPKIAYNVDGLSMIDIFGEEWLLLDKDERAQAEEWFQKVITEKALKGIRYEHVGAGEYLYMRIPNDKYAQDK